jgi:flagellin
MPLVINTNVASLNTQRQLVQSGSDLDKAMERLSSGRRINTAADDAAGLAISNRMTSQIRGLNQAVRNANDGVSLIQTAEGAMDETTNILQRMRELAIQSANGIYSDTDRRTLDAEVQQLKEELDRIANSTTFNGNLLLDGSLGEVDLQVGSQAYETITMSIPAMDIDALGGSRSGDVTGLETTLASLQVIDGTAEVMSINGQSVGDLSGLSTLEDMLEAFNASVSGIDVTAFTEYVANTEGTGIIRGTNVMNIDLVKADGTTLNFEITDTGSMEDLVDKINEVAGNEIQASLNESGLLTLLSESGATITVTDEAAGAMTEAGFTGTSTKGMQLAFTITDDTIDTVNIAYSGTANGNTGPTAAEIQAIGLDVRSNGDITGQQIADSGGTALNEGDLEINGVSIGAISGNATEATQAANVVAAINALTPEHGVVATVSGTQGIALNSVDGTEITIESSTQTAATVVAATGFQLTNTSVTQGNSVADIEIATVDGAQESLSIIDTALETINDTRSQLGAISNRLEFTMSNLANVVEKTEASRSRIMDADFAAESANLSRAQVLQQASQAMLAQANARPQQVLSLLQG